jgi:NAD+ kinase
MKRYLLFKRDGDGEDVVRKLESSLNCHLEDGGVEYDGFIVVGGDGTVLRALQGYTLPPPIYAINCGKLGFLCPISLGEVDSLIEGLRRGEDGRMKYVERMRLCASEIGYFLNEAVFTSEEKVLCSFRITVDGIELVARGDAVIVASRTGSSGYNLSAGGPLLLSDNIVITVVAPNRSNFKPIVCRLESRVRVEVLSRGGIIVNDGVTYERSSADVFYDGSVVRFGYVGELSESRDIRKVFVMEDEISKFYSSV